MNPFLDNAVGALRLLSVVGVITLTLGVSAEAIPTVHDERLRITLFAEDPDIVTPIGLAIGPDDRLFVVESHTHSPPQDYPSPQTDRIRVFQDHDQDGHPEANEIFAQDLTAAMNITVTKNNRIFVACARSVWELIDKDNDNQSESRRLIVEVKTKNAYPHSCLLGITHSDNGWLYLSRGNNGSMAYTMLGTDQSTLSGYGDGGNVTRCRFDGSTLEEFATGFWNPFDIEFAQSGHLIAIDNDPDARGPNRVVDVVQFGDYGYKSMFGGGGNHAYQGWDGDLPGTLPYISGTGEAPSGVLDAKRTSFPADYQDSLLVTVWNEHTIERHRTQKAGQSLVAKSEIFVSGPQSFRPVAIDSDSHGNVYLTDWVLVDYPNHGKGRIWKISTKDSSNGSSPEPYAAGRTTVAGQAPPPARPAVSLKSFVRTLETSDPYEFHAAVVRLGHADHNTVRARLLSHSSDRVRLGAALAQKLAAPRSSLPQVRALLQDPTPRIREAALQWIGSYGLVELRDRLPQTLEFERTPPRLFNTFLATQALLQPQFRTALQEKRFDKANQIPRPLELETITGCIANPHLSPELRAIAVTDYPHNERPDAVDYLKSLVNEAPPPVQQQAIRSLANLSGDDLQAFLLSIAIDETQALVLRQESLLALEKFQIPDLAPIIRLTQTNNQSLTIAAVRLLALHQDDKSASAAINRCYVIHRNRPESLPLVEDLEDLLYNEPGCCQPRTTYRPTSPEEWQHALAKGGDPIAGEAVFFSLKSGCAQCHTIDNRGGKLGPDLSNAGQSVSRQQLIHSILKPSDQFPPQFQAWVIETTDGEEHRGLQLDHKAHGAIEMFTLLGTTERFEGSDIANYYASSSSLMPDGLEAGLSTSELRDLVAFLESRQ